MNRIISICATIIIASLLCFGCATQKQPMYYWGNYSQSLYDSKKKPGRESLLAHRAALEHIAEESKNRNLRVPPGVYAELGYIYNLENNFKEAIKLFDLEKRVYPESTVFMDRLIQQADKRASMKVEEDSRASFENEVEKEKSIGEEVNE